MSYFILNYFLGVSDKLLYVFIADDTNEFLSGKDMNTLIDKIQLELSKLYAWLLANKLTIHISKINSLYLTELGIKP